MAQPTVPVLDLAPWRERRDPAVAAAVDRACREVGFLALTGHGVDLALLDDLDRAARAFFALPDAAKAAVALARGGAAWRGWFPLGGELTSGVPDLKEGFYAGREEPPSGRLLQGPNVFPDAVPALRPAVLAWMAAMEDLGQDVLAAMAVGLGLDAGHFARGLTAEPTVLFRLFRYPPHPAGPDGEGRWGVARHSDYGLLTLLAHDGRPGLEVEVGGTWVPVPADRSLLVCNLGDMLDRLTGGRYRSTPHRVRNHDDGDRLSFPFFLDPGWDVVVEPLELDDGWAPPPDAPPRWDGADLGALGGRYGDWLTAKVRRVFPDLFAAVS